ncbi:hypothetical protein MVEG_00369 [Podila verticillata NRRL 6337]|nr:hypothetical protein MVEG_00369 [Podila verticillata NRRL 6337]
MDRALRHGLSFLARLCAPEAPLASSQATLTSVNLQCIAYQDDNELVWFFQQLQTLDRLTLLVLALAMQHIRQARSIISESGQEVSQFFCFHLVTSLEVWRDLRVDKHCSENLKVNYPWLTIKR